MGLGIFARLLLGPLLGRQDVDAGSYAGHQFGRVCGDCRKPRFQADAVVWVDDGRDGDRVVRRKAGGTLTRYRYSGR